MGKLLVGITYVLMFARWILSIFIYIWTLIIAYNFSGLTVAIITAFLPFLGQAYWGIIAYQLYEFESPYIQWLIVLIIIWIVEKAIVFGSVIRENKVQA